MPTTITGTTGVSKVQPAATQDNMPLFGCRAWVNFDGTRDSTGAASTANTARFIRASGNVTSVVRNGTGDYTVNFTTAMPDANFMFAVGSEVSRTLGEATGLSRSTTTLRLTNRDLVGTVQDTTSANIAIFR